MGSFWEEKTGSSHARFDGAQKESDSGSYLLVAQERSYNDRISTIRYCSAVLHGSLAFDLVYESDLLLSHP